ncbi:MAG: 3-deoxy-8-phosphooctulonate synthase [Armatimonadetes bacterium]|nr:3-deoxy-8-phosphooctulonate synthase [Armatimonadota bacterium]
MNTVTVSENVSFGSGRLALIAGPCVIEDLDLCLSVAGRAKDICERLGIGYVFKASFDKANRTSVDSYRGPGLARGLEILAKVKNDVDVPLLTDVHETWQVEPAAEVVDILQIPAFLCRQTDLLLACGQSERVVNVKKGQFVAPHDMVNAVRKIESTGNQRILLSERGASFGYNTLIADMTSIPVMQETGYPVVFDATHSVQRPGGQGTSSGGNRQFIPALTRAAMAAGADALFIETHPNPEAALSDAASQLPLDELEALLESALRVFEAVR